MANAAEFGYPNASRDTAENLAILHHIALNLLKHENTCKPGVKARRLRAGWDNEYLFKILAG